MTDKLWRDTKLIVDGVQLYMPLPRYVVCLDTDDAIYVEMPPEIDVLADILSRLPPDRTRAETRALDWCCENYEIPNTLAPVSVR